MTWACLLLACCFLGACAAERSPHDYNSKVSGAHNRNRNIEK